jgi:hypothetical protein
MGCLFSYFFRSAASADIVEVQPQVFSWYKNIFFSLYIDDSFFSVFREREDRKAIKKEDFILDKLKDQTIYRLPGSVNGQQFIVQNCDVNNRD